MRGLQVGLISTEHGVCLHHLTLWVIFICLPHIGGPTAVFFSLAGGKGFLNELFEYDCTSNFQPWYCAECTLNSNICLQLATVGRCYGALSLDGLLCSRKCSPVNNSFIQNIYCVLGSQGSTEWLLRSLGKNIFSIQGLFITVLATCSIAQCNNCYYNNK